MFSVLHEMNRAKENFRQFRKTLGLPLADQHRAWSFCPISLIRALAKTVLTLLAELMPAHQPGFSNTVLTLLAELMPANQPASHLRDLNPGPTHYECVALPLS